MALIDELRQKSEELVNSKKEVISEIKEYFNVYLHSEDFEKYLRTWAINMQKKRVNVSVEFWKHLSGCSETHFRIGNHHWYVNPKYTNYYNTIYKGVDVAVCQAEICAELYYLLKSVMEEKGFIYIETKNNECHLGWYDKELTFTW